MTNFKKVISTNNHIEMKKHFTLIFLLLSLMPVFAQEVLLEEEDPISKMENDSGPNTRYFSHLYYGVKWPIPPQETGSEILFWKSYGMDFGHRSKIRFNNIYSVGFDFSYAFSSYRMKQSESKITPDDQSYDKQWLRTNELRLAFFNRFNFEKRRGNHIGRFLDLGVYGAWHFREKHKTEIEDGNSTFIGIHKKLDYFNTWNYGALARLGLNHYVITFNYRVSDLFTETSAFPELPRMTVGLELGLHQ